MTPILVHLQPFDLAASARIDVRVGDAASADAYGLGGVSWSPALTERPIMSLETMSPDLDGKVLAGRSRVSLNYGNLGLASREIKWIGSVARIYSARELAWPAITELDGQVIGQNIDIDNQIATLTLEVDTTFLEGPFLILEYDGSGGLNGEAATRGTLRPSGFGVCENIEPVWFDTTRWIGQIDGYGNTTAITRLTEGLADRGARVADYATYAALAAAIDAGTIKPGQWGTCVAQGLVGLGAPPVAPIGVNATFNPQYLGAMMYYILIGRRGVPSGNVNFSAFNAMDVACPYPASFWTKDQRDCKDLIEAMAMNINATPLVTFQRMVTITRGTVSAPVGTLDRSGKQLPRVIDSSPIEIPKPIYRLRARTARPANVLSYDQVLFDDTIEDKGAYSATETYRSGHIVWSPDKSSWLYINATPDKGHAPPAWPTTSNAYWQNMTPPVTSSSLTYADGTPIEARKPAEAGANVTETRTAAAILGQGALATSNAANWATQVLGIGKPSNNAGTSRVLQVVGVNSVLTGNTLLKVGGTHGAYQGGVVGDYMQKSCFISAGLLYDASNAGGWVTTFALDVGTGTVTPNSLNNGSFWCTYTANTPNGALSIYKRVAGGNTLVGSYSVPGLTDPARRLAMVSNGRRVFVMIGGTQYGGDNSSFDVPPGQNFYPRIFDFHRSEFNLAHSDGIVDIQYGNWNDVRVYLDDGYSILAQAGFRTIEGTANAITGQGPGATAPGREVLNYDDVINGGNALGTVRNPGGGQYAYDGGNLTGAICIDLPVGYTNTMIRFAVDIFNYLSGTMQTYIVSGYTYTSGWINISAQYIGSESSSRPVRFGIKGTKCRISIGDSGTVWAYPKVIVRDVMTGYSSSTSSTWRNGWGIAIIPSGQFDVIDAVVAKPRAADAVYGESIFESASGALAALASFKTQLGTAAAIIGQGTLATVNAILNSHITNGVITAIKFLTDQGVDLAAIVPGSLNFRLSTSSSTDYSGGGWNGSGYNPQVNTGPINPTGTASVSVGHRIVFTLDIQFVPPSPAGGSIFVSITAYYRINGGAWTSTGVVFNRNSVGAPNYTGGNREFLVPSSGTLQLAYGITGSMGPSGSIGDYTITDHSLSAEATFWK